MFIAESGEAAESGETVERVEVSLVLEAAALECQMAVLEVALW